MDAKEEVRSRLDIEDVIGEYVQLKRAGRSFKGLSPFTGEKTPSFYVSPDKQIWHDFSSNKGGDVFAFVMEVEGMDFRQALEHLARKAGVELADYESKESGDIARRKKRLLAANDLAATYYQQSLAKNTHALEYVRHVRGLSNEIIQTFRLGYAPDVGDALRRFLDKKSFTHKELTDAGLTNRYGSDLFRGRLMVPLMDGSGQVIGFTGRIIEDIPNAPKYLNTPQTLLYDKSRHVFGLSQAKEAIRTLDQAVIVEGNLDVVSSHQAGVRQVVATAGTAMTESHLKALKRLTANIRLAFDADKAGIQATERAIPIASQVGLELTIISLPDGAKDPDELVRRDLAAWQKAIDMAEPAVDWVLKEYEKRNDLKTAAGKRAFTTAGLVVVSSLTDPVERDHYMHVMATMTNTSIEALHEKSVADKAQTAAQLKPIKAAPSEVYVNPDKNQDALLAVALQDTYIQDLFRTLEPRLFSGEPRQAVAAYIRDHGGTVVEAIPESLQSYSKYVTMLLLNQDVYSLDWNDDSRMTTASSVIRSLETNGQNLNIKQLQLLSNDAKARGDKVAEKDYLRQISELLRGERRA